MGKLAELNIPTREGNLRNPERLNQNLKDIGRKAEPWKHLATEGVSQVLLGDEGTIPWYMSFAPGADLIDKLMEGRQPGLLDVPGPGTLGKAAILAVNKDVVKALARWLKSDTFEKTLSKLPTPVQESYLASFGDLSSKKLKLNRQKIRPNEIHNGQVHGYPFLETFDFGEVPYGGEYAPFGNTARDFGRYQPQIYIDRHLIGTPDGDASMLHEGSHLMDEAMGTAQSLKDIAKKDNYPYYHPFVEQMSDRWLDDITKDNYPLHGIDYDYQEITGKLSPIEYRYHKKHPEGQDTPADWWLSDDPHGRDYFMTKSWGLDDKTESINEPLVSTEALAQFVESIPELKGVNKTLALKDLVRKTEQDPRRLPDFSIDFNPFMESIEKKLSKQ